MAGPDSDRWWFIVCVLAAFVVCGARVLPVAAASENSSRAPALEAIAAELFNVELEQITVGPPKGTPPVLKIERDGRLIGYLASTWDVSGTVGYSGKPIDILIAVDVSAKITGARLVSQREPILTIGISDEDIARYVSAFAGYDLAAVRAQASQSKLPDLISGASVSSGVIRDGIIRTGRAVAVAYNLLGEGSSRKIDRVTYKENDWAGLNKSGAVLGRKITIEDARTALGSDDFHSSTGGGKTFLEIYAALLTPPQIGQNLLGHREFTSLFSSIGPLDNAILVAASGLYSFKGTRWRRSGTFERIELIQGARTIKFSKDGYRNVEQISAAGAPEFRETGVFVIPASTGFDPARPWRLSVLVSEETAGGAELKAAFPVHYKLPDALVTGQSMETQFTAGAPILWQENWRAQKFKIAVVVVMLTILWAILFFQGPLTRRIKLYRITRLGFLSATVLILGVWFGAQLSVVHVLAFAQAIRTGFQWDTFLLDPLIFILWSFVAVALLFWGRGVFCGWLCPFGALQELLNKAARKAGIKQIAVPFALHERLWPIKYILFLAIFALSLHSIIYAFWAAEVEPFKTVVTLKFMRTWPFVVYAGVLLFAGLFIERFFCRYLCPLGAALAIPARLRMFEWLKRRHQCGKECRICATKCIVQAIHPDGHINPNECIHCLNCQILFNDETVCPPLKARAQRRNAHRNAMRSGGKEQANG
jgi:NosR/NirI family nitrite reductase transcriptional regulator